jgi:hypothetical protein
MDSTPPTDPSADGASLDAVLAAPASGAIRAWRQARRAAWLVLVVAALGMLLQVTGVFRVSSLLPHAGTVGSRVLYSGTVTAPARALTLYPYAAEAPGPGCDRGAATWTLINATPAQNVVCTPTATRLIAIPLGTFVGTSLRGAPLPARYAISLAVSGITPCTAAIWHVATETRSGFDLRLNGPAATTCGGPGYDLETTYPSGAGGGGGQPYPVQTASHTIVLQVDGAQVRLLLDGVPLESFTDVAPPVWSVVQLGVSQMGGSGPASADFANFTIM